MQMANPYGMFPLSGLFVQSVQQPVPPQQDQAGTSARPPRAPSESSSERNRMPCPQCDKSFATQDSLNRHIRTAHEGIRPFACETCRKTFTRKDSLTRHARSHQGPGQFACDRCGQRFTRKDSMMKHSKSQRCQLQLQPGQPGHSRGGN